MRKLSDSKGYRVWNKKLTNVIGKHRGTGIGRPRFWDRASYYNLERELAAALDELGG